ncbi:MAG: chemotaxis-specific protein-glutamate methyltransferase CheB [Myxococcota bacterium]
MEAEPQTTVDPARVLVIDDSVLIRRVLSVALAEDPRIDVVGWAVNGAAGLAKIKKFKPEIVILDMEMPVMGGLEVLETLATWPNPPKVIVFSQLQAETVMTALTLGAAEYVVKPANPRGRKEQEARMRDEILPKILGLLPRLNGDVPVPKPTPGPRQQTTQWPVEGLVIGASTGGPNALASLLAELPPALNVPILIVQHMPLIFTRLFADRLNRVSSLRVAEAQDGEPIEPHRVYVAPGGVHMAVGRGSERVIRLEDGPREHSCKPAVDVLFRSAARSFGPGTLGVVLTGMGRDGCAGAMQIREAGGHIISQDQASSVVWGMPGAVAKEGASDAILPLEKIPSEICRRVLEGKRPRARLIGGMK